MSSIKVTIDYAPSTVVMIIFIFVCIPDGHGPGRNLRIISRVEDSKGDILHPDSTLLGQGHCHLHAAEQQAGDQDKYHDSLKVFNLSTYILCNIFFVKRFINIFIS